MGEMQKRTGSSSVQLLVFGLGLGASIGLALGKMPPFTTEIAVILAWVTAQLLLARLSRHRLEIGKTIETIEILALGHTVPRRKAMAPLAGLERIRLMALLLHAKAQIPPHYGPPPSHSGGFDKEPLTLPTAEAPLLTRSTKDLQPQPRPSEEARMFAQDIPPIARPKADIPGVTPARDGLMRAAQATKVKTRNERRVDDKPSAGSEFTKNIRTHAPAFPMSPQKRQVTSGPAALGEWQDF